MNLGVRYLHLKGVFKMTNEEKKLTKKEQLMQEYETTVKQINSLFLKLCIWELEVEIDFSSEKDELISLRKIIDEKLTEVLKNEKK